jgi:hypothetical protein
MLIIPDYQLIRPTKTLYLAGCQQSLRQIWIFQDHVRSMPSAEGRTHDMDAETRDGRKKRLLQPLTKLYRCPGRGVLFIAREWASYSGS